MSRPSFPTTPADPMDDQLQLFTELTPIVIQRAHALSLRCALTANRLEVGNLSTVDAIASLRHLALALSTIGDGEGLRPVDLGVQSGSQPLSGYSSAASE